MSAATLTCTVFCLALVTHCPCSSSHTPSPPARYISCSQLLPAHTTSPPPSLLSRSQTLASSPRQQNTFNQPARGIRRQHRPASLASPAPPATTMTHTPAAANTGIPLHCNICPKKPFFSDTSHLLTHIASKQHLSNYFKLKVRVSTDPVAHRDVKDYDRWYEEWNLDDLMRERMSQKERRNRGFAGSGRRTNGGAFTLQFALRVISELPD